MASSEVGLVNRALISIGRRRITSLDEDSAGARVANEMYPNVRDEVLAEHQWNEAVKRASLSQLTAEPEFGYDHKYQIPNDFIRLIEPDELDLDWAPEGDAILSDEDDFQIIYVHQLKHVTRMRPNLQKAIAMKLAAELTMTLSGDMQLREQMERLHASALRDAKFADSQQSPIQQVAGSTWLDARTGGGRSRVYRHFKRT